MSEARAGRSDAMRRLRELEESTRHGRFMDYDMPHCVSMAIGETVPEPECHLRVIDIYRDKHVWGVLDEGCNSTCHGTEWRKNANKKFARRGAWAEGKKIPNSTRKHFRGIGTGMSDGKYRFCMGIALHKKKSIVHSIFDSHELPGTKGSPN